MQISALYDALDQLVDDVTENAETFAADGELKQLAQRLRDIGNRAWALAQGAESVADALKFEP